MWNMVVRFAKTKLLSVITKVNIKDVTNQTSKLINKIVKGSKNETTIIQEKKSYKEPKWQAKFPFSFFFGSGKFQPIYFFVTMFCFLALCMLGVKIYAAWNAIKKGTYDSDYISTSDLATVLAFISSLILLYNNNKKNYSQPEKDKTEGN